MSRQSKPNDEFSSKSRTPMISVNDEVCDAPQPSLIKMTPSEQLSFWNLLQEPAELTLAQKRLGRLMQNES